ncbi:MAG TPA: hypothetical protein VEZ71_20480, partial [Archangium sp.]|nr:hypothetical protein [Archangium sp.]
LGEAVRELARQGGPLWGAVWRELEPLLFAPGDRATWLGRYECDDVSFWVARLLEQDLGVRVVAIRKLAHWKNLPRVREALLWQLLDGSHGVMPGTHGEPALAAAAVLREAPRTEELLDTLRAHLEGDDVQLAGAAAVALLPGEADANRLLSTLRWLFQSWCSLPMVRAAIEAHCGHPEGRAWLESNWPQVLAGELQGLSPHSTSQEEGDTATPPPSRYVRGDVLWSILPALREPALLEKVETSPFVQQHLASVYCVVAETAPEAMVDSLRRQAHYFPWEAQETLGRAALQWPELGSALVERWDKGFDALPGNFPGVAL